MYAGTLGTQKNGGHDIVKQLGLFFPEGPLRFHTLNATAQHDNQAKKLWTILG